MTSPKQNSRARILYINYSLAMGGIEKMIVDFVLALPKEKYEIHVAVFEGGGVLEESLGELGIAIHHLNKSPGLDWKLVFNLRKLIRELKIDIVHTNNFGAWVYSTLAQALPGRSIGSVHTEHSLVEGNKARRFFLERMLSRRTGHVIAVSEQVRTLMIEHCEIPATKIKVITNGIATDLFKPDPDARAQIRAELDLPPDCIVIGTVSRLAPVKDHLTLLRAFSRIHASRGDARLLLVGDGECKEDILSCIEKHQLADSVVMAGERRDTPHLLAAMDVYVVSSLSEGMSLSLLEALSTGLPVVATNVGGNPELVEDGANGLLVPCKEPQAMADAIAQLLNDDKVRASMSITGRERVRLQFSKTQMTKNYSLLYDELSGR